MTLIQTAKLNGVEPMAWLTDVLERIVSGRTKATRCTRCCRGPGSLSAAWRQTRGPSRPRHDRRRRAHGHAGTRDHMAAWLALLASPAAPMRPMSALEFDGYPTGVVGRRA